MRVVLSVTPLYVWHYRLMLVLSRLNVSCSFMFGNDTRNVFITICYCAYINFIVCFILCSRHYLHSKHNITMHRTNTRTTPRSHTSNHNENNIVGKYYYLYVTICFLFLFYQYIYIYVYYYIILTKFTKA